MSVRRILMQADRYICDILQEMRTCHKSRNYSYLPALIEEVQCLANRMETALEAYDEAGSEWILDRITKLKQEKHKLKKDIIKLTKKKEKKKDIIKLTKKKEKLNG
jgi:vacuolar-type H+-ATPase subunit E/Vma4